MKINLIDLLLLLILSGIVINRNYIQNYSVFSLHYYELFGLVIIYVALRNTSDNEYYLLALAVICNALIQVILTSLQLSNYTTSNNKYFAFTGCFLNPGVLAGFFVSTLAPLFVGYMGVIREKLSSYFTITYLLDNIILIICVLVFGVTILTSSRAACSAIVVFLLLLYFPMIKYKVSKITNIYKGLLFLTFSLIAILTVIYVYLLKKDSANGRWLIWCSTFDMIKDVPFTGVGYDGFKSFYMNYQAMTLREDYAQRYKSIAGETIYAFNDLLQLFAENGVFIGASVIILVILLVKTKIEDNNKLAELSKYNLVSIAVFSLFSYPSTILLIKINVLFYIAILAKYHKNIIIFRVSLGSIYARTIQLGVWGIGLFFIVVFWKKNSNLINDFHTWNEAREAYNNSDYVGAIEFFREIYPTFSKDGDFLMQYGKALELNGEHLEALKYLEPAALFHNTYFLQCAIGDAKKGINHIAEAESCYMLASSMIPARFYADYLLAHLYYETGQKKKARSISEELLSKRIKIQSMAIDDILKKISEISKKTINE